MKLRCFFDHAYLELHLLLMRRERNTYDRWLKLCLSLIGLSDQRDSAKHVSEQEDEGLVRDVAHIRTELTRWIKGRFPARKEDFKKQIILARVAAGLNFANKRSLADDQSLSNTKKIFSFLYAAAAARELFDYCRVPIETDGPVAQIDNEVASPSGNSWREVWEACDGFNGRQAGYVLLVGPDAGELPETVKQQLGRLPWSLVVDFDPEATEGRFIGCAGSVLKRLRGLRQMLPHQPANIDFETGTCWLFLNPKPVGESPKPSPILQWKQKTLPPLRKAASDLLKVITPKPINIVVLAGAVDVRRLGAAIQTLEEQLGGTVITTVVSRGNEDHDHAAIGSDAGQTIHCDWTDLGLGVHEMLGDLFDEPGLWIPVRDPTTRAVRREQIDPAEAALYAETIDIVPAGPLTQRPAATHDEVADFLRGNIITWHELDLHLDVDRDVIKGPHGILQKIRRLLDASPLPTDSFTIEHKPGAGATTVARRIAWELRDDYPSLVIKDLTDSTGDILERLFQRCSLPLLIVAEAARLPGTQREKLFNLLKTRNIRFVILDVRRRNDPKTTANSAIIGDPMSSADAQRFLVQYQSRVPESRRAALRDLATKPDLQRYRSPFFFGLYAFERDFVRVPEFVKNLMQPLAKQTRHVVAQLALIKRYSQRSLPAAALRVMLGFPRRADSSGVNVIAPTLSKIVMFDDKTVWIPHPVLAEEILRQHLTPAASSGSWLSNLSSFCQRFIADMAVEGLRESSEISEVLGDLFIERGGRQDANQFSAQFSALLIDLGSRESQRLALESLCEHFPDNAHFWNHLGRHISLQDSGTFSEAEEKLQRAITIQPNDDMHHHALGMVYRKEVRVRLQAPLGGTDTAETRFEAIQGIFTQAEECFATARSLNRDSQYPVVTPIQMILETFERLAKLAKPGMFYSEFLKSAEPLAEWCRAKIVTANELLSVLRHQEAEAVPSGYRVRFENQLQGILGNFDAMVSGLTQLLQRADVARAPVRRMIAQGYLQKFAATAAHPKEAELRRVVKLMEENLAENPAGGHDVRTWFRAYRMLPDFTLTRAIEQMSQWSLASDDIDARYYLYILHFMWAREGMLASIKPALENIELCRKRAPLLQSKKSFEWYAAPELHRRCPLVHHSELGAWSSPHNFFEGVKKLALIQGRIDEIRSPTAGTIQVSGLPAFFVPRTDFTRLNNLNDRVTCFVGFSYEGLRAWNVNLAT